MWLENADARADDRLGESTTYSRFVVTSEDSNEQTVHASPRSGAFEMDAFITRAG